MVGETNTRDIQDLVLEGYNLIAYDRIAEREGLRNLKGGVAIFQNKESTTFEIKEIAKPDFVKAFDVAIIEYQLKKKVHEGVNLSKSTDSV